MIRNPYYTAFNPSHYARDLLLIMLENEPGKRIFSNEVVDKIKSIKFMVRSVYN